MQLNFFLKFQEPAVIPLFLSPLATCSQNTKKDLFGMLHCLVSALSTCLISYAYTPDRSLQPLSDMNSFNILQVVGQCSFAYQGPFTWNLLAQRDQGHLYESSQDTSVSSSRVAIFFFSLFIQTLHM